MRVHASEGPQLGEKPLVQQEVSDEVGDEFAVHHGEGSFVDGSTEICRHCQTPHHWGQPSGAGQ